MSTYLAKEQAIANALASLEADIQNRQTLVGKWMQQAAAAIDFTVVRARAGIIAQDDPLLPSEYPFGLPAALDDVLVRKGMAKSERDRYKNAREFAVDLEKAVHTGVSAAKAQVTPKQIAPITDQEKKRFDREGRTTEEKLPEYAAIGAAVAVGATVVGGLLWKGMSRLRQSRQERERANDQQEQLILLKKWDWIGPTIRTAMKDRNLAASDLTKLFLRIDTFVDDAHAETHQVRVRVLASTGQQSTDETILAERIISAPDEIPDDIRRELTQQAIVERDLNPVLPAILASSTGPSYTVSGRLLNG